MDNKEYSQRAEHVFWQVEQLLDRHEDLLDYDRTPDKLQIAFEEHQCAVLNP